MKSKQIIKCPQCGAEYLPSEIFYRDELSGKATNIQKDYSGKILAYMDNSYSSEEEYECDFCRTKFKVIANIMFTAEKKVTLTNEHIIKKDVKSVYLLDENL